ncbi:Cyclic pyranopterin monophosphate synthase [Rhodospirillaceae bacterium LM-1]|nr:Cyclic pyranopterin monophosphate synthase [Rhodospirillaceae bacterium LM-1]
MMRDNFGRQITYLRVSITDRCDLKCGYCNVPGRALLERREILSLEEIERICKAFVAQGVTKIRITGGEPLVRRGVVELIGRLNRLQRLDEVTLTTNGTQLDRHAQNLAKSGVRRLNVSLDSLDAGRFQSITGRDALGNVLSGIQAAKQAGLKVKINMVVLVETTDGDIDTMIRWCGMSGHDLTLIEVMPMGPAKLRPATSHIALREHLAQRWSLTPLCEETGGPASYVRVGETGGKLGFITPMSANFCASCNRVRLTSNGKLKLCLDRGESVDLRGLLRSGGSDEELKETIVSAIRGKPSGHDFLSATNEAAVPRSMSAIGG